jgi:serine/threonine protein kinase
LRNRSGDATGAISDADQSIGLDPTYATAYRFRAQAREQLGHQAQQILADFKKAAELDPEQASYYSDAVTRLGGQKSAPNPDTSQSRNIYAGIALLLLLLVAVWSISRRRLNPGAPSAAMTASAPAELGGQYDIGEKIGEGGMGAVYKGWDKLLKRPVAIKRLIAEMQENQRDRERFIREAETVASLHHPNIVEIYTIIRKSEQETYLVFEYLVGDTVHQLLDKSPGHFIAPARALEILRPMAEAVDYAHSRGVIHRDLKPANVMIADNGWVKVMDFGIARQAVDSRLTMAQTIAGTPSYMAPEQAMGAAVKESDIYALGCTLYEMLTGALPFQGSDPARDKIEGLFTPPSKRQELLPKTIDAVLAKALSPRSQDRYHSGRELYLAAAAALGVIS